ncbi:MAG: hypothetical protein ACYS6W_01980 [Planctomycetota bacterium]|jgi:hypothetical protein
MVTASEIKPVDERKIPIRVFDKKRFIETVTVTMVTYSDGTAKLFDEDGEIKAIGEPKRGRDKSKRRKEAAGYDGRT